MRPDYHCVIVGGGLHGALTALALAHHKPEHRIALVEQAEHIGGHHLWSFHADDAPAEAKPWLAPLVQFEWPNYEVRFSGHRRVLEHNYRTITSEALHAAVTQHSPKRDVFLSAKARECTEHSVHLADGTVLHSKMVIDARGPSSAVPRGSGFQKFVGLELLLESDHGITTPILMDASIEQIEGFRFMYVLPFGPRRLFVEDTYFCESPILDVAALEARIREYSQRLGLKIEGIGRRESGVLPMPWQVQPQAGEADICLGVRGNWYHPATAYSVPCALRCALAVAAAADRGDLLTKLAQLAKTHEQQAKFARFLNRMLFGCFEPDQRAHVFERFYRLPEETIRRFYALEMTLPDRVRILSGRPPRGFSLRRALRKSAQG
tara:strand:- start:67825 stop:68961 length:1137 start_codon:yes stop_codon:yes gene_type:complete